MQVEMEVRMEVRVEDVHQGPPARRGRAPTPIRARSTTSERATPSTSRASTWVAAVEQQQQQHGWREDDAVLVHRGDAT